MKQYTIYLYDFKAELWQNNKLIKTGEKAVDFLSIVEGHRTTIILRSA